MPLPISVFIIAKNEADRIPASINSVIGWVDEVIVIDSGSDDDTVAISESLGAQVLFRAWEGYGPQKVFGEGLCRNKWVLNIDADEAVSPKLKAELTQLFAGNEPEFKAYQIPIKIVSRFASKPSLLAPSNDPIRFYHKQYAGFKDSTVHDSVVFRDGHTNARAGHLKGILLHRCFRSYTHAITKINYYSTMQAEDMFKHGRKPSALRIMIEPILAFMKAYTLRRYFLLGVEGVVESLLYALARTIRLAKARELWKEAAQK